MGSKARHVLYGTLYVVEMYRWGELAENVHHYTAGIFDNEQDAKECGIAEHIWRGGKYDPIIYTHNINEWRNGSKQDVKKEIEGTYPNKQIDELWEGKKARFYYGEPDNYDTDDE
jgi:hypothetical protein